MLLAIYQGIFSNESMADSDYLVLTGNRVLTDSSATIRPMTLLIESGKIIEINEGKADPSQYQGVDFVDAGDDILMPGIVDAHVLNYFFL